MPQAPKSELQSKAFKALLYRINDVQLACTTDVLTGSVEGIQDYATR